MTVELNPRFTFDTFVVGGSNRLAATAARSVAETPGTVYNPLFIYGPSGLGKTHLLMAIGHLAQSLSSAGRVVYQTLEEFLGAHNAAVAAGQGDAFRNRFGDASLMLLDDIQFLTDRREAQAALLRVTLEFGAPGRQIVFTSDRPPAEIAHMDERLIGRVAGGLLVDVTRPDVETRLAILKRKAEERHASLGADVLEAVARVPSRNVRELLGLLNRVVAFQAVNETPLTGAATTAMLQEGAHAGAAGAAAAAPAAPAASAAAPDEFQQFFSNVSVTLSQQVEVWKARLGSAIMRWQGEGYKTTRLDKLMKGDSAGGTEQAVQDFEKTVEQLRALEAEMAVLVPEQAGDPVFRDPERLREAITLVENARDGGAPPPGPSAAWAFDEFQAGDSNRAVLAAAMAVCEHPGERYNPLVIVGPNGLGKTHLLHAIGHALSAAKGALVACLSAQDFMDELTRAVETKRLDQWRSRYRRTTAFLLDDLHVLAGKDQAQEELFNLYNLLFEKKRQMVFTLNTPPIEVSGLADRIVSRLDAGLVTALAAPDRELRMAVISRLLVQRLGSRDETLAEYLADRPADSVRAVATQLQHVLTEAESRGVPPTAGLARELVEGAAPKPKRRSSVSLRTSGIIVSPLGGLRSHEKVVWVWPEITQRLLEDA